MIPTPIDLIRGGRTERFYSPYDNAHALEVLEGMLKDRRVCSSFAEGVVRTCRNGKPTAQDWAWVHRIIIDHEGKAAPPPRQAPRPPAPIGEAGPPPRAAVGGIRTSVSRMSEDQVRAYVKDLLRTLQVAELRRLADDCWIGTTDPVQAANWKAVGREIERRYPTTQARKYLTGPEDVTWAEGLIAAFGDEGALEAVLDVQRDVDVSQLDKWGRVETAIRRLNAEKAASNAKKDKPRKRLKVP